MYACASICMCIQDTCVYMFELTGCDVGYVTVPCLVHVLYIKKRCGSV